MHGAKKHKKGFFSKLFYFLTYHFKIISFSILSDWILLSKKSDKKVVLEYLC